MLIVISPAKTLDYATPPVTDAATQPAFLDQSEALIRVLRNYSALEIAELMKLSIKLAELNFERYQGWERPFTPDNAKQAALAMKGEVYTGLDAESFSAADFDFAQRRLRILSGLYGVLRPLDLMFPYRLEMGTKLKTDAGDNLYQFWGDRITEELNRLLAEQPKPVLVNLASAEYFKAVRPKALNAEIVTPQFKDRKGDVYKMIGFYAKKARGLMSRFAIQNRIEDPEALKTFDLEGYRYNPGLSKGADWVFTRG